MPIARIHKPDPSVLTGFDMFCGGGGCSVGYTRAGLRMIGTDWKPQRHYPYQFIRMDIRYWLDKWDWLADFDFIHASPPCQEHSRLRTISRSQGTAPVYINLIPQVRECLEEWAYQTGGVYIIENVLGAPIRHDVMLCGTQFGMEWGGKQLQRHRVFESNIRLTRTGCKHKGPPWGIYGSLNHNIPNGGQTPPTLEAARELMGIDWMSWRELREAIPPVYTEHLGAQVVSYLTGIRDCELGLCS